MDCTTKNRWTLPRTEMNDAVVIKSKMPSNKQPRAGGHFCAGIVSGLGSMLAQFERLSAAAVLGTRKGEHLCNRCAALADSGKKHENHVCLGYMQSEDPPNQNVTQKPRACAT
eukprot:6194103-Pleurochrysis_carterae.AAC.1